MEKALLLFYGSLFTALVDGTPPPNWPQAYQVMGTISIPFAEIEEPFAAFYDAQRGLSRIDYYGGMDRTFQRTDIGEFGTLFKIVPMTDEHLDNTIRCFQTNGTQDAPVQAQSILPDLAEFEFKGEKLNHFRQKRLLFWGKVIRGFDIEIRLRACFAATILFPTLTGIAASKHSAY